MLTFRVTREALSSFYAAPASLLVSADIYAKLKTAFPTGLSIYHLDADGTISSKGSKKAKNLSPLSGMPPGLLGVVTSRKYKALGEEVCQFADLHGTPKPELVVLSWNALAGFVPGIDSMHTQFVKFLNGLMAENLTVLRTAFGEKEQQLVHLRHRNEQLWLNGEKARRMISGLGYSTRSVSFELLPGDASIVLDTRANKYSQILPTDLAGFAGVSLFLSEIPQTDGKLDVTITRSADNALVGSASVPFHSLREGWNDFSMSYAISLTFGNGVITVSSNQEKAPKLMLADSAVDRFGVDNSSIALRIYKGLEELSTATNEDKENDTQHLKAEFSQSPAETIRTIPDEQYLLGENSKLQIRVSRFSEILGQVEYYRGLTAQQELTNKYGFSPLMISEGTGAMQTHPLTDALSATFMAGGAVTGARRIMAEIGTGHESAPDFTYILMVLPSEVQNRAEVIEEIAEKVRVGVHHSDDIESGVYWSSQTIKPLRRGTVSIGFDTPRTEAGDVVFAVISQSGNISFGWCNWYLFANITEGYDHPVTLLDVPESSA